MDNCIFCKIVNGEIPSEKIYENLDVLAFLDINPVNVGHTLIIPKKHLENIHQLDNETIAQIMSVAKKISSALVKIGADGVNVTMNNGKAAGQIIFHSHIHVIPRKNGDGLPPWPQKKAEEKELKEVAEKLIGGLASL